MLTASQKQLLLGRLHHQLHIRAARRRADGVGFVKELHRRSILKRIVAR